MLNNKIENTTLWMLGNCKQLDKNRFLKRINLLKRANAQIFSIKNCDNLFLMLYEFADRKEFIRSNLHARFITSVDDSSKIITQCNINEFCEITSLTKLEAYLDRISLEHRQYKASLYLSLL